MEVWVENNNSKRSETETVIMNHICNALKLLFSIMHTDDRFMQIGKNYVTHLVSSLKAERKLLSRWLKANKLSLSAQKTRFSSGKN